MNLSVEGLLSRMFSMLEKVAQCHLMIGLRGEPV